MLSDLGFQPGCERFGQANTDSGAIHVEELFEVEVGHEVGGVREGRGSGVCASWICHMSWRRKKVMWLAASSSKRAMSMMHASFKLWMMC